MENLKPIPGYEGLYAFCIETIRVWRYPKKSRKKGVFLYPRKDSYGYLNFRLSKDKKQKWFRVHRLVYEAYNGKIPAGLFVDHIDRNKTNNDISNLRLATSSQNLHNQSVSKNNKLGVKGVTALKGKYSARISHEGKSYSLGLYETVHEASEAYNAKGRELHGEFHHPSFV
jgi:hypothetical protein